MSVPVVLDGYAGLPPVTIGDHEHPVSASESIRVVSLKVGDPDGYARTELEPAAAMGVCAAIVERCKELGVDVVDDLLAWCLAIHVAPEGVTVEDATRRVEGRLLDAAVDLTRRVGNPDG